mmetsp:Transcript_21248/g.31568  ORF Transcript_21248/g.31568 Transcript_21248/m.31568 type:complete len:145 (+) Transcript_21248:142-576(+)
MGDLTWGQHIVKTTESKLHQSKSDRPKCARETVARVKSSQHGTHNTTATQEYDPCRIWPASRVKRRFAIDGLYRSRQLDRIQTKMINTPKIHSQPSGSTTMMWHPQPQDELWGQNFFWSDDDAGTVELIRVDLTRRCSTTTPET